MHELQLGFLSGRAATVSDDGIFVDAGMGRLIDVLSSQCARLVVALARAPQRMEIHDHRLKVPIEDLIVLPPMPSYARALHQAWSCHRAVRELEARTDVSIVQLPFQVPAALFGARRPRLYHVCSDVRALAAISPSYRGARRVAAVSLAVAIDAAQQLLVRAPSARLVANGRELFEHYGGKKGRAVVSSSILESEILGVRRARPREAPFRVLFVGYLRPEKGVDTLLAAFELVRSEIPNAELLIVGARPLVDRLPHLRQRIDALSTSGSIRFAGQLPFGPELFACFADGDVLVLPSLSEGTPRVLIEARAFGCPVIASNVGGIPSSVHHEVDGLLVPPRDPSALARAILRVARDAELRGRLVDNGVERARSATVEAFAAEMLAEIDQLVGAHSRLT